MKKKRFSVEQIVDVLHGSGRGGITDQRVVGRQCRSKATTANIVANWFQPGHADKGGRAGGYMGGRKSRGACVCLSQHASARRKPGASGGAAIRACATDRDLRRDRS